MSDHDRDALVPVEPQLPTPVFSGGQMTEALAAYQSLQASLDHAMSDQLMLIGGKPFRKKGYWRAVRIAFQLEVHCIEERHTAMGDDWGYEVTYRATAPNGASADGDGACMASEKATGQDTVHNVRGHAHTRAFNRAVSNLVGFGEVSFDEMPSDEQRQARRGDEPPRQTREERPRDDQRDERSRESSGGGNYRWMREAQRASNCLGCGEKIARGAPQLYAPDEQGAYCPICTNDARTAPLSPPDDPDRDMDRAVAADRDPRDDSGPDPFDGADDYPYDEGR